MVNQATRTIEFEDHGQDFLEWEIDKQGNVVGSHPFQEWLWCKFRVVNHHDLEAGGHVYIQEKEGDVEVTCIKYPLVAVSESGSNQS